MTSTSSRRVRFSVAARMSIALIVVALVAATGGAPAQVHIAQSPLYVGTRVPGNLALVPSVEFPTILSPANLGPYDPQRAYVGYFDADKCYHYRYSPTERDRHFTPVRFTQGHACNHLAKEWSGNFMNWATTQTIDPFRLALTGGYRVRDVPGETWLEKARHDRNELFDDRSLPASGNNPSALRAATPAQWNWMRISVAGQGNRMQFRGRNGRARVVAYNPDVHNLVVNRFGVAFPANAFEVSVRVRVCVAQLLEANCKQYRQGWKPEGLIQEYSERVRFSVFSYLNDSSIQRDGGVLRANQKFVGPQTHDPTTGPAPNTAREWDPDTGVIYRNPDPASAAATGSGIQDSGVINYINKAGQLTTQPHKAIDPVSELYYAAIRYFKRQGNVAAYSAISPGNLYIQADGFPVITQWHDPVQYQCQANVILGIGDVNTHRDKNLPGSTNTSEEPSTPPEVSSDRTVNVVTATNKVAELEGFNIQTPFTGRNNSAYIAGLAYDSHTRDIRPDLEGTQTLATHWVDVRERAVLEPRARNPYWLATKYGGFRVPEDFQPYERTEPLPDAWWHDSGDILASGDKRPDNFHVASEAEQMVAGLRLAFSRIARDASGTAASLASNSTRLESGAMVFQARFHSPSWRGELSAFALDATGAFPDTPTWNASDRLAAMKWEQRMIHVHNPQAAPGARYRLLTWDALGSTQKAVLGDEATVNYLRGDRSNEGRLRERANVLGDIVHSQPVFVGQPEVRRYANATFRGGSSYTTFANAQASRRAVVYVGANDGLLHGFDASTGDEVYAFLPAAAITPALKSLTSSRYEHRYFVDGELTVADVYSTTDRRWKTVLVGSMGRGGRSVFALDVTDPDDVRFLWERTAADIPALGHLLGKPIIAQVADGDWRVLLGNGPNGDGGAALITIGVESGRAVVTTAGPSTNNALSAVEAWDSNRDGFHETVYGGDFAGNLWRFRDVAVGTSANRLFAASDASGNRQPITAAPLVLRQPDTGVLWVYFGTGRYLGDGDLSNRSVQTWYAVMDGGREVPGRAALLRRRILAEVPSANSLTLRATSALSPGELDGTQGWFLDLVSPVNGEEGERMVVPSRFERGLLIGTTRIPDATDVCKPGGRGFIMALDPFTGARPSSGALDANGDGVFDGSDNVAVGAEQVPASGVGFGTSPNAPTFLENDIHVVLDDGTRAKLTTRGGRKGLTRTSWRELLLDE